MLICVLTITVLKNGIKMLISSPTEKVDSNFELRCQQNCIVSSLSAIRSSISNMYMVKECSGSIDLSETKSTDHRLRMRDLSIASKARVCLVAKLFFASLPIHWSHTDHRQSTSVQTGNNSASPSRPTSGRQSKRHSAK